MTINVYMQSIEYIDVDLSFSKYTRYSIPPSKERYILFGNFTLLQFKLVINCCETNETCMHNVNEMINYHDIYSKFVDMIWWLKIVYIINTYYYVCSKTYILKLLKLNFKAFTIDLLHDLDQLNNEKHTSKLLLI